MAETSARTADDYILDSYRGLFLKDRDELGLTGTDMVFDDKSERSPLERALVLTAGLGTRLQPLTLARAKAAAPVDGEPLARRTIHWLVAHGVTDLVLNLHHEPDRSPQSSVTAATSARASAIPGNRRCSDPPAARGTPCRCCSTGRGSHSEAAQEEREVSAVNHDRTLLLVNGDTLTNVDLTAMTGSPPTAGALVTMALIPNPRPDNTAACCSTRVAS